VDHLIKYKNKSNLIRATKKLFNYHKKIKLIRLASRKWRAKINMPSNSTPMVRFKRIKVLGKGQKLIKKNKIINYQLRHI